MVVQNIGNNILGGLSSDTKPTIYAANTLFFEFDTGGMFVWSGSVWNLKTPGSDTAGIINVAAQASTAELLSEWKVSDDTVSYVRLLNNTTNDAHFAAAITARNATASGYNALYLTGEVTDALDTGTNPVLRLNSRRTTLNPITTRPLLDIQNNGTSVLTVKPATVDITVGDTIAAAEILQTWKVADGGTSRLEIRNSTATDGEFHPQLRSFNTAANNTGPGLYLDSFVETAQDSGTQSVTILRALKADSTAPTVRPLYDFRNGPSASILKLTQTNVETPLTVVTNKTSAAGVAELLAQFKVSDDVNSFLQIQNNSGTDTVFAAKIQAHQQASSGHPGLAIWSTIHTTHDTGAQPGMVIDIRRSDAVALATRPLLEVRNAGTSVFKINAATYDLTGTMNITKTSAAGVAETLQEWKVSDDSLSKLDIINASSTDAQFAPLIRGYFRAASTAQPGLYIFSHIPTAQDSGTTPAFILDARKDDNAAIATRPLFRFRNAAQTVFDIAVAKMVFKDAYDIEVGTTTGTKIGTGTTQKIGFYNATPVVQGASIADVDASTVDGTYGAEEQAVIADLRTKVNSLISRLEAVGLIATV